MGVAQLPPPPESASTVVIIYPHTIITKTKNFITVQQAPDIQRFNIQLDGVITPRYDFYKPLDRPKRQSSYNPMAFYFSEVPCLQFTRINKP